jgi:hypothetical protein
MSSSTDSIAKRTSMGDRQSPSKNTAPEPIDHAPQDKTKPRAIGMFVISTAQPNPSSLRAATSD